MGYYEENALEYIEKTISVDMSFEINRFLHCIPEKCKILDLGCGSGRDSFTFNKLGYDVYCLDPVFVFCENARKRGIEENHIINKSILDFNDNLHFDAIWACASLLHLSNEELKKTIEIIKNKLEKDGFLYMSFKYGEFEGIRDSRFYIDMTENKIKTFFLVDDFEYVDVWVKKDKLNRGNDWLNIILRKK